MKHGRVRNKAQQPCLCLLPARPVQEQQGNGSVQAEETLGAEAAE